MLNNTPLLGSSHVLEGEDAGIVYWQGLFWIPWTGPPTLQPTVLCKSLSGRDAFGGVNLQGNKTSSALQILWQCNAPHNVYSMWVDLIQMIVTSRMQIWYTCGIITTLASFDLRQKCSDSEIEFKGQLRFRWKCSSVPAKPLNAYTPLSSQAIRKSSPHQGTANHCPGPSCLASSRQ